MALGAVAAAEDEQDDQQHDGEGGDHAEDLDPARCALVVSAFVRHRVYIEPTMYLSGTRRIVK